MTDEEILKRLAEIEGRPWDPVVIVTLGRWNPLTNWSDLGPLIEKHHICINRPELDYDIWSCWAGEECARHESLPHAICLAIIEAHK